MTYDIVGYFKIFSSKAISLSSLWLRPFLANIGWDLINLIISSMSYSVLEIGVFLKIYLNNFIFLAFLSATSDWVIIWIVWGSRFDLNSAIFFLWLYIYFLCFNASSSSPWQWSEEENSWDPSWEQDSDEPWWWWACPWAYWWIVFLTFTASLL